MHIDEPTDRRARAQGIASPDDHEYCLHTHSPPSYFPRLVHSASWKIHTLYLAPRVYNITYHSNRPPNACRQTANRRQCHGRNHFGLFLGAHLSLAQGVGPQVIHGPSPTDPPFDSPFLFILESPILTDPFSLRAMAPCNLSRTRSEVTFLGALRTSSSETYQLI